MKSGTTTFVEITKIPSSGLPVWFADKIGEIFKVMWSKSAQKFYIVEDGIVTSKYIIKTCCKVINNIQ